MGSKKKKEKKTKKTLAAQINITYKLSRKTSCVTKVKAQVLVPIHTFPDHATTTKKKGGYLVSSEHMSGA